MKNAIQHHASNYSETSSEAAGLPYPKWIQLPKSGTRCPVTGLSRSAINACILPTEANGFKPPVKSRSIKSHRYATRGVRLVNIDSLLAYIEDQPSGIQADEAQA